MKIAIMGYSGSGKSTLASRLSEYFDIPKLHLDAVHFVENWQERNRAEAKQMVADFMQQDSWAIDGNYNGFLQAERLEQADHIIILQFSRWACLWRVLFRYLHYHNRCRDSMAAGCNEKLDLQFVWWILYEGRDKARRAHYDTIVSRYPAKTTIIKNQRQLDAFISKPFGLMPADRRRETVL